MAAPAWVSNTGSSGANTTSATITLPTTAADDILIVSVINGGANAALTLTTGTFSLDTTLAGQPVGTPAGWAAGGWGGTYWVRCTGNHSGQTIIASGATDSCSILAVRYSGCITTGTPYDATISEATVAAGANMALAAFVTASAPALVVLCNCVDDNIASTLPTKGGVAMNNLGIGTSTGGADSHVATADLAQAAPGTTGAFAMTFAAGTNAGKRATAFALKPPLVVANDNPTGTINLTGTGVESNARTEARSGQVTLSGSATDSYEVGAAEEPEAGFVGIQLQAVQRAATW